MTRWNAQEQHNWTCIKTMTTDTAIWSRNESHKVTVKHWNDTQLTSWPTNKIEEADFFSRCWGTRSFIAVITMARQRYVSWARWIQSTASHPIFTVHFEIMLSLKRRSSKRSHSFGVSNQIPTSTYLSSYTCHVPRPSDPPKVVIIDECHRLWGISFCNFLQSKLVWIYGDKHFSIASEYWWGRWAYMIQRFMFQRWR